MLSRTVLFEARTGGYWNYRVPGILCTRRGVILVTTEARRGGGGDWDSNDIILRRSLDGGLTWGAATVVVGCDAYGPGPVSNFAMISDRSDGTVHALYCHDYARVFYQSSTDDGATFTAPLEITASLHAFREQYPWRVIATGPGHGIQIQRGPHRGRLVVPVWMSDGSGAEFGPGKLGHRPSAVAGIYSDDGGQTWQCGDFVVHTDERIANPSETIPVELSDGRVLFNIRSESPPMRRLFSVSPDGAHGWSEPRFDGALHEPVCMASILRLEHQAAGKSPILFANPDNLENELIPPGGHLAHDRKRLAVKVSVDDCQTWPVSRILEAGPAGYSDLAETLDGTVLCVYECGMIDRMTDTRSVTVARFDLAWLSGQGVPAAAGAGRAREKPPVRLRAYMQGDRDACLAMFDGNTPDFFAPHERAGFETFLEGPADVFWVAVDGEGTVAGCSGYWKVPDKPVAIITWTMVDRNWHGRGVGRLLFLTCLDAVCRVPGVEVVELDTSQHITGFYARVGGFGVEEMVEDGYWPGLHKVVMRRERTAAWCGDIAQQLAAL